MTSIVQPTQAFGERRLIGEPRLHTDGELLLVGYAQDGSLLTVEEPGILRRWDGCTGQSHLWHVLSDLEMLWALSHDGQILVSASDDVTIWDTTTGEVLTGLTQKSWVTALAIGQETGLIATGHDDGHVRVWDGPGHRLLLERNLRHPSPISAIAISPDGRTIAVADEEKRIILWDLDDGSYINILEGHHDRIPALVWHPEGRYLVSASWDGTARVWDSLALEPLFLFNGHEGQVTALAFSPDGKYLATADSGLYVRVWNFEQKRGIHLLSGPDDEIRSLAFSPDGQSLACNGAAMIHIWSPQTGEALLGAGPRPSAKPSLAISPDGKRLAGNVGGIEVQLWDAETLEPIRSYLYSEKVHGLAFSPDGKHLAGAAGESVRIWDVEKGLLHADWDGPNEPITDLAYSADGLQLATAGQTGYDVWLWRTSDGEPSLLIPDALDGCSIEAFAFHPDGEMLAVGGIDYLATGGSSGSVSFWNLPQRAETAIIAEGTQALAFSPDGKKLAYTNLEQGVVVWNVLEHEISTELMGHESPVTCLAFAADGHWLATGSEDNTVRLWNEQGEEIALLEVESRPTEIAFSPNGRYLYIAHANTTYSRVELPGV